MSGQENISVQANAEGLQLTGPGLAEGKNWQVRPLGKSRILLDQAPNGPGAMGDKAGFGLIERNTYVALLYGLVKQRFDGVVAVDLGNSLKRIYFRRGELIFAGSNLMDDRLGEVLYREGLITLDQMTEAAVEVNRTTKFGRVLIQNEVFSSSQLWDALRTQVVSIFQSTFLQEYVYVQLEGGENLAPTQVSLDIPTEDLIDDSFGYASMIYQFRRRLDSKSVLRRVEDSQKSAEHGQGTFVADTIELAASHGHVTEFLKSSKLTEINSLCAIFDLVHRHIFSIEHFDANTRTMDIGPKLKEIKGLIDAYHMVLDGMRKAFVAESTEPPIHDIEVFLDRQYSLRRSPLFVLSDGTIGMESVVGIFARALSSHRQAQYMAEQLQALIRFALQLVGDLLPGGKGWEVKKSFSTMIS